MGKIFIEKDTLIGIADAVRAKNGTTEPIRTTELATAITNLPTGGGENKLPQMLNKTITELYPEDFGGITSLPQDAFKNCKLTYIELNDEMTTLGKGSFYGTTASTIILNKALTTINADVFRYTTIPATVKYKGTLTDWFNITILGNNETLLRTPSLYIDDVLVSNTVITIPEDITVIKGYAMRQAILGGLILHNNITAIGSYAFYACKMTGELEVPASITSLGSYALGGNNWTKIINRSSASIPAYCFNGCSELEALVLTSETLVSLSATNAFANTPIASGTGYIYVPSSLLEEYKVATNWVTYAEQFRAIEDYPEICGGAE